MDRRNLIWNLCRTFLNLKLAFSSLKQCIPSVNAAYLPHQLITIKIHATQRWMRITFGSHLCRSGVPCCLENIVLNLPCQIIRSSSMSQGHNLRIDQKKYHSQYFSPSMHRYHINICQHMSSIYIRSISMIITVYYITSPKPTMAPVCTRLPRSQPNNSCRLLPRPNVHCGTALPVPRCRHRPPK